MGFPPMQINQHIENLAAMFRHTRGLANRGTLNQTKKRKRPELDREEEDMEVEEDGKKNNIITITNVFHLK